MHDYNHAFVHANETLMQDAEPRRSETIPRLGDVPDVRIREIIICRRPNTRYRGQIGENCTDLTGEGNSVLWYFTH